MKPSTAAAIEGAAFGAVISLAVLMFALAFDWPIPWWAYLAGFLFMWPAFAAGALLRRAGDGAAGRGRQ